MNKIKSQKYSVIKIISLIFFFIAFLVCLFNFGKEICQPFQTAIKFEKTEFDDMHYIKGDKFNVAIDDGDSRTIFVSNEDKINAIHQHKLFQNSVVYYKNAVIDGDDAYVLSYEKFPDTGFIKSQKIVKYDSFGKQQEIIWSQDYNEDQSLITTPMVNIGKLSNNEIYGLYFDKDKKSINFINLSKKDFPIIQSFAYEATAEYLITAEYSDLLNHLYFITNASNAYVVSPVNTIKIQDYKNNQITCYLSENDANNFSSFIARSRYTNSPQIMQFSDFLIFNTYVFWVSAFYCAIFLLVIIIKFLIKRIQDKNKKPLIKGLLIFGAAVIIFGISVFYSFQIFDQTRALTRNNLKLTVSNISSSLYENNVNELETINSRYDLDKPEYLSIKNTFDNYRTNSTNAKTNLNYSFIKIDNQDILNSKLIYSTYCEYEPGSLNDYYKASSDLVDKNLHETQIVQFDNSYGNHFSAFSTIFNKNNKPICAVIVELDYNLSISDFINYVIHIFIILVIFVIIVAFIVIEIVGVYKTRKTHKEYVKKKYEHSELAYYRIFGFLTSYLGIFNGVLLVLISQDIVVANNYENLSLLIAIPPTVTSVGMFFGQPVFAILSKKLSAKTLLLGGGALLGISFITCFYSVQNNNFIAFCFATFVSSMLVGMLYSYRSFMAVISPNENIRYEINKSQSLASISAGVISVAVSGIISDTIGASFIYVGALIPVAMVLVFAILFVPKNTKYDFAHGKNKNSKIVIRDCLKLLRQPYFVAVMLLMITPVLISGGYKSFIFPLLTDGQGISKSAISNFVVIANFATYIFSKQSKKVVEKIDFWYVAVIFTIAIGMVYLSFTLNDTILWSVAAIAIFSTLINIASMSINMLWPRACKIAKLPVSSGNSINIYYLNIILSLKSIILGWLITFGIEQCCIVLGVYIIVSVVIFTVFSFKSKLRDTRS